MPTVCRGIGRGLLRPTRFFDPVQHIQVAISGFTRNSTGAVLPNCDVHLFRTSDDREIDQTVSDAVGYYEFRTAIPAELYYAVAYLVGSPDVAGTTVNTLTGGGSSPVALTYDQTLHAMSGLIGEWYLDEVAGNALDYTGTNPGTYVGTPTRHVAGPIAGTFGVTLDGSSQYITIADHATLDLADSVSFVGWIKRSSGAATDQITTKGINSWQFHLSTTPTIDLLQEGVGFLETSSTVAVDTNWHQVGFVKVGGDVRLYYDAVNVSGSLTNQTLANTAEALEFGRRVHDGTGFFHGSLSRFALFNRALTAGEFSTLYAFHL